jgi:uncharacterized membrane protein YqjE
MADRSMPGAAPTYDSLDHASTKQLLQDALAEGRELVELEVKLAKEDVKAEIARVKVAAIGFGLALSLFVLMLSSLSLAAVLALGGTPLIALLFAAGFLVLAAIAGAVAWSALPKKPLERTVARVKRDVTQLKEHVA